MVATMDEETKLRCNSVVDDIMDLYQSICTQELSPGHGEHSPESIASVRRVVRAIIVSMTRDRMESTSEGDE